MSLAQQRYRYITKALHSEGSVTTIELARALHVSTETVRRDLIQLERDGVLRRVYGGAVAPRRLRSAEPPYAQRTTISANAKAMIGELATTLVKPGQFVFLDVGTTAQAVAKALTQTFDGTIVSHSLLVALELAQGPKAELLLAPGRMRRGEWSLSGAATHKFLADLHFDVAFISCGGVDASEGPTDYDHDDVELKRTVARNSKCAYIVADSSKHGVVGRYGIASWYDFHGMVTDSAPPAGLATAIESVGGMIQLPGVA